MNTVSRLYTTFQPTHYDLHLHINHNDLTFSGTVTATGSKLGDEPLRLHAKDLQIAGVAVDGEKTNHTVDSDTDELVIDHADTGDLTVTVEFAGVITDTMHGLYPCYYTEGGVRKHLIATQFESHHAREAFPCVDEPEAKATFSVTIASDADGQIISNMPVKSRSGDSVTFDTTPRMSTYLLAFVLGDLQRATAHTASGIEVNVYATPVQPANSLSFALEHAVKTIEFFDDYFGVPYPLPKSDHVALPDFSSGAMENWGLVTYRESALLATPGVTSLSGQQYIALVIAHELSHQWFGNLVTMKWWNNLWLNESFATLMEYIAVDAIHPEWQVWQDFAASECVSALRRDAIDGVQPVQTDVHHPDEISTLFDGAIVYAKGARLLQMLMGYIGPKTFRQGLGEYFRTHAYANTTEHDLWDALSTASGHDIAAFMTPWISQSGYPLVTVREDGEDLALSQTQFFVGPHTTSKQLWPIPLPSGELFDTRSMVMNATDTFTLNPRGDIHVVTHYPETLRRKMLADIRDGHMGVVERLNFLHEQTLLARAEIIPSAELVNVLTYFASENNEKVWDMIALVIAELRKFIEHDETAEQHLRELAGRIASAQYKRLGWTAAKNELESDTKLRSTIIGLMLYARDPHALTTAYESFDANALESIDPELRSLIIGSNVRWHETPALIDTLIQQYRTSTSVDLQGDIMSALCTSANPETVTQLCTLLADAETVRPQNVVSWYASLLGNKFARDIAWQWCRDSWPWIAQTFGSDKSYDYFPRYSAMRLATRTQLEEYTTFFSGMRDNPGLTRVIDMGITDLTGKVELIERQGQGVKKALAAL